MTPEFWEHTAGCEHCQRLLRTFDDFNHSDAPGLNVVRNIKQKLLDELRPVRPLPDTTFLFLCFVAVFVTVVAGAIYRLGAFGIPVLSSAQLSTIFDTLAVSSGVLAYALTQQMTPGKSSTLSSGLLPVAIPGALFIEMAALFHFQPESHFWANDWTCLSLGMFLAVISGVLFWLILRRGAILNPQATGATAGLLAGLVGITALEIHCPNLNVWHILSSHLAVAVLALLCGLAIGSVSDRRAGQGSARTSQPAD